MAAGGDDFESWLSSKLLALNTDESVFSEYIKGILEGEETLEDKTEALEGILSEITVSKFHVGILKWGYRNELHSLLNEISFSFRRLIFIRKLFGKICLHILCSKSNYFSQENDIPLHCREILEKWKKVSKTSEEVKENNVNSVEDMEVKLVRYLESQPRATTVQRTYTEDERRVREAILAQYSQVTIKPRC